MAKRKTDGRITALDWVIRILIITIFAVSLGISMGKLMKWNENRQRAEELREQKEQYEQSVPGVTP